MSLVWVSVPVCVCVCVCEEVSNVGGIPVPLRSSFSLCLLLFPFLPSLRPICPPSVPYPTICPPFALSPGALLLSRCLSFFPSFFQIASSLSFFPPAFCLLTLLEQQGTPGPHRCCLINSFHRVNQKNRAPVLDLRALEHARVKERHKQTEGTERLRLPGGG